MAGDRRRSTTIRAGLLCGVVATLLWAAIIVLGGALRPGFDHVGQYISELGERGSSVASLVRYGGFVATGILHLGFAAALHAVSAPLSQRPRLALGVALLVAVNGLGRIGAGLYTCTPGCAIADDEQRLHSLAASLAFFAVIGATLLGALLFRAHPHLRPLAAYSLATGTAAFAFLALMSAGGNAPFGVGLYERLASGVLSLWILVTALRLRRLARP
jgi:hypothetical membrane protein